MVKNPHTNVGDTGLLPGLARSPGEGNGNPLRYSCLGNPMNRGAWRATVHGAAELDTTLQLNNNKSCNIASFRIPPDCGTGQPVDGALLM